MGARFRITLVNMPFGQIHYPSFALSQLVSVLDEQFGDEVETNVVYANHELARLIGVDEYQTLSDPDLHDSGVGEWMFREAAFPDLIPNGDEYLDRYFKSPERKSLRTLVRHVADVASQFCQDLVVKYSLGDVDLLGCTSLFAQTTPSLALMRAVKAVSPAVTTALGGANCEAPMGAALVGQADALDLAFSGPALRSFPQVVRRLLDGETGVRLGAVPGVISTETADNPIARHSVGVERPVDELVEPDFSAFLTEFQRTCRDRPEKPTLFFETSRGCWWGEKSHCTFCGLNGSLMDYRRMAAGSAVAQFDRLFSYYPWCTDLFAVDNIMPSEYVDDVFARLNSPPGESIMYEVKVNKLGRRELETLAAAGVTKVQPGIEALATHTLKLMGKGVSSFQNITFLKNCVHAGVSPFWNLITGFPGELEATYEHYARYLPLLHHLPPPGLTRLRFDRYSPYFTRADEYGLELRPLAYYGLTFPFDEDTLSDIAYYFRDEADNQYKKLLGVWWSTLASLVDNWRRRWRPGTAAPVCRLEGSGEQWRVIDTRGESMREHALDSAQVALLVTLDRSRRVADLDATENRDVATDLAYLRSRGLVFEEGERLMSVVQVEQSGVTDAAARP